MHEFNKDGTRKAGAKQLTLKFTEAPKRVSVLAIQTALEATLMTSRRSGT